MVRALARVNGAESWLSDVAAWGGRFQAISGDRFLYLWLHRLQLLGSDRWVLEGQVRPGMAVADIGANLGLYTYLFSRCVGPNGVVYAFEPDPSLFGSLECNCKRNGIANAILHNVALGSRRDSMVLNRSLFNAGDNRLAPGQSPTMVKAVSVKVLPLDDVLEGRTLDFIKIDVQGWEREVFAGMRRTLANSPNLRIYLEFWPAGLRRAGSDPLELLAFLTGSGFQLHLIDGRQVYPLAGVGALDKYLKGSRWTNLLAIR
jgi:FkbM family methyltransferase